MLLWSYPMLHRFLSAGICSLTLLATSTTAHASSAHEGHSRPDDHAPIGVMGGHTHQPGEWMTSYRYSRMNMSGNRSGNDDVSNASVLGNFMVTPLEMTMEMHMVGLMYGATNELTFSAMLPYTRKDMQHVNRMGAHFTTKTDGVGDIKISGLYTLYESSETHHHTTAKQQLLLNLGASLPTGSIDERGNTPAGNNQKLPYPMQLGSGTLDPLIGLTYTSSYANWSWGTQANSVLRFGKNNEGYRLGNEYSANLWAARALSDYASISVRLEGKAWGDIHGQDQDLNVMMVPTARTDLRGGERVDALVGLNLYQPSGALAGQRLALEYGTPIYQRLDGPQLEVDHRFTLGWQWAF